MKMEESLYNVGYPAYGARFIRNDVLLVAGGGGEGNNGIPNKLTALQVNFNKRKVIKRFRELTLDPNDDSPTTLDASNDIILMGCNENSARIKSTGENHHLRKYVFENDHLKFVASVDFDRSKSVEDYTKLTYMSQDGSVAAIASSKVPTIIRILNPVALTETYEIETGNDVKDLHFSPDGKVLSYITASTLEVISIVTGRFIIRKTDFDKNWALSKIRFIGEDTVLIAAALKKGSGIVLVKISLKSGTTSVLKTKVVTTKFKGVTSMDVDSKGQLAALAGNDNSIAIIRLKNFTVAKFFKQVHSFAVTRIVFSPDSRILASVSAANTVHVVSIPENLASSSSFLERIVSFFINVVLIVIIALTAQLSYKYNLHSKLYHFIHSKYLSKNDTTPFSKINEVLRQTTLVGDVVSVSTYTKPLDTASSSIITDQKLMASTQVMPESFSETTVYLDSDDTVGLTMSLLSIIPLERFSETASPETVTSSLTLSSSAIVSSTTQLTSSELSAPIVTMAQTSSESSPLDTTTQASSESFGSSERDIISHTLSRSSIDEMIANKPSDSNSITMTHTFESSNSPVTTVHSLTSSISLSGFSSDDQVTSQAGSFEAGFEERSSTVESAVNSEKGETGFTSIASTSDGESVATTSTTSEFHESNSFESSSPILTEIVSALQSETPDESEILRISSDTDNRSLGMSNSVVSTFVATSSKKTSSLSTLNDRVSETEYLSSGSMESNVLDLTTKMKEEQVSNLESKLSLSGSNSTTAVLISDNNSSNSPQSESSNGIEKSSLTLETTEKNHSKTDTTSEETPTLVDEVVSNSESNSEQIEPKSSLQASLSPAVLSTSDSLEFSASAMTSAPIASSDTSADAERTIIDEINIYLDSTVSSEFATSETADQSSTSSVDQTSSSSAIEENHAEEKHSHIHNLDSNLSTALTTEWDSAVTHSSPKPSVSQAIPEGFDEQFTPDINDNALAPEEDSVYNNEESLLAVHSESSLELHSTLTEEITVETTADFQTSFEKPGDDSNLDDPAQFIEDEIDHDEL